MKIATWNVDRPSSKSIPRNKRILDVLGELNADILVLTETNSLVNPGAEYGSFSTPPLLGASFRKQEKYAEGENRVTIWTKYPARPVKKYHSSSTVCACISTPLGELIVYGTVIGIYGRGNPEFTDDLERQIHDWQELCKRGNLCIAGDFNQTFGDETYYTKAGRQRLEDCFLDYKIQVLTKTLLQNVDHIAVSESFAESAVRAPGEWNKEKDRNISTHNGTCVTLERS